MGGAFKGVQFTISNIKNTDFNAEEEEERYTGAFDFVPGAVENMERSLEMMRKYVKKTIDSFQTKKAKFREEERKLAMAFEEQQMLLKQMVKEHRR